MLFFSFWLAMLDACTQPITVQVTVRVPRVPNVIDFAAERAKRRKA